MISHLSRTVPAEHLQGQVPTRFLQAFQSVAAPTLLSDIVAVEGLEWRVIKLNTVIIYGVNHEEILERLGFGVTIE
jgi:hypothetical protein